VWAIGAIGAKVRAAHLFNTMLVELSVLLVSPISSGPRGLLNCGVFCRKTNILVLARLDYEQIDKNCSSFIKIVRTSTVYYYLFFYRKLRRLKCLDDGVKRDVKRYTAVMPL
jgi:hypothetical protein